MVEAILTDIEEVVQGRLPPLYYWHLPLPNWYFSGLGMPIYESVVTNEFCLGTDNLVKRRSIT